MPELPEVETCLQGLKPHLVDATVKHVVVRQAKLRYTIPETLNECLSNQILVDMSRRGKYLLLQFPSGQLVMHLGMSGHLRIIDAATQASKHDHVDIAFTNGRVLRLHDPRRFSVVDWWPTKQASHRLLCHLGVEPLSDDFNGDYLYRLARRRKVAVKNYIMDNKVVVGVGNIYASESLFRAGIHPKRHANAISLNRYHRLAEAIVAVLKKAIESGGTTLKDFINSEGKPGYFSQQLQVYGRTGLSCYSCQAIIKSSVIGQRNTFYCASCQH